MRPLSTGENSSKRDKLSLEDIQTIISIEKSTDVPAMSWFSSKIWDDLKKNYISHEYTIPIYREILKQNMSNFMFVLWYIQNNCKKNGKEFLINSFLKPKFNYFDYDYFFDNLGNIVLKKNRHKTDSSKDELNRYVRIAFESINDFNKKENRNIKNNLDEEDLVLLSDICKKIEKGEDIKKIKAQIQSLMSNIQLKLIKKVV